MTWKRTALRAALTLILVSAFVFIIFNQKWYWPNDPPRWFNAWLHRARIPKAWILTGMSPWTYNGFWHLVVYLMLGWIPYFRAPEGCVCRKCRHELRGLSEPRCPECGEAI